MRKVFLFLILIFNLHAFAQTMSIDDIKRKYSKYNAVITNQEFFYVFDIVKDSLLVKQHNSKEVLILNDHSKGFTNDYIYNGSFSSISNIQASTLVPKGKGYEKMVVTQFKESHDMDGSVFYDDSKTIHFAYPSLKHDAKTSLKYSIDYLNPRFIRQSYFQSFVPIIQSKVIVKVHKDIKIGYKLFNDHLIKLKHHQYSKGKYNYFVWEVNDILPYKYLGANHFGISHFSPHIALFVEHVKLKSGVQKYYSSVDELYHYYYQLVSRMENNSSDAMKQLVEEITRDLNDWGKAKAIYYWVQNNIKYVAYLQGYMGFVPVSPSEVFAKRFGDCKGMSALLNKMMELAGLHSRLSWVGTRRIPYAYNELPLPAVDNHMVTSYLSGDSVIIMDGTFNFLDFGVYPYHIQGKEVLIGIDDQNYRIFKVPVSPSSYSMVYDSVAIAINGNSIKGSAKRIHTGFNKMELAYAMDGVKEDKYTRSFTRHFSKGNNKFKVDTFSVINLFRHDMPAEVNYDFTLDDYYSALKDEIFINLNLDKSLQNMKVDTSLQYSPIINDFYCIEKCITWFEIPEGYAVTFIPGDDAFDDNDFKFSLKYFKKDNYIILEKVITLDFFILPDDKLAVWNKMVDQLNKNYRLTLALKRI